MHTIRFISIIIQNYFIGETIFFNIISFFLLFQRGIFKIILKMYSYSLTNYSNVNYPGPTFIIFEYFLYHYLVCISVKFI